MQNVKTKFCKDCKAELPLERFSHDYSRRDSYAVKCKTCYKIYYKNNRNRLYTAKIGKVSMEEKKIFELNVTRANFIVKMVKDNFKIVSSTRLP
jgi:hypothetical protein